MRQPFIHLTFFSFFLILPFLVFAQGSNRVPDRFVEIVRNIPPSGHRIPPELWVLFEKPDADPVALIDDLRAKLQPIKPKSQLEYNLAFLSLQAQIHKNNAGDLASVLPYCDTLLQLGISSNDINRQAHATWFYGSTLYPFEQIDEAATYCWLSMQLSEKLPYYDWMFFRYTVLAEILFRTEDYRPCIDYGVKALKGEDLLLNFEDSLLLIRHLNTIGQAYYRLGIPDSAAYYYGRSKQLAAKRKHAQWVAINESFEGQLYLDKGEHQKALSLFEQGYLANKDLDPPMESFSLAGMGQSLVNMGQTEKAKPLLWQALGAALQSRSTQRWQVVHYRKNALTTLAAVYQRQNRQDSFYYYAIEADRLEDSMVKVVSLSNLHMAEIRGEVERSRMQVAMAAEKEQRDLFMRNLIIACIVVTASVIILFLSRQNRILQLEKQMAHVKQQAADAEIAAAREQLDLFTRSLHEKTRLLDQLQQQEAPDGMGLQMEIIRDLTRQAIVTEDDWQFFKTHFDKIYPGFFMRLRQTAPDISMSEQRFAALTLLNMNAREMAAMLGISPDSIRKTRQRLRQRLQLDAQDDLDTCIQRFLSNT